MIIQWFIESFCGLVVQVDNQVVGMAIPCGSVTDPWIQVEALQRVLGWLGILIEYVH